MIYREKQYGDTLCHFNPNHDPRTGQFTANPGEGKSRQRIARQMTRADEATKNVKDWMNKQKAKGGGGLSGIKANMAEVMYESVAKNYRKLDKMIDGLGKNGDKMSGSNWKEFNDRRIEIGKDFVERTTAGKAGQFALRIITPPVLAPVVLGSGKYKYTGD